ncbi:MAG: PEP-CTERM sorting domain-containing protein [Planctomycetota bacterium]
MTRNQLAITASRTIAAACSLALTGAAAAATLTWTGAGDGSSFEDESNWDTAPTGGTIVVTGLLDDYVISDGGANVVRTETTSPGVNQFGLDGNTLTLNAGSLDVDTGVGGNVGIDGGGTINVFGGDLISRFIGNDGVFDINLDSGSITLTGGNDALPNSTAVDFVGSLTGALIFTSETVTDVIDEYVDTGRILVNGVASDGSNLIIVSDGGSGAIVTVVPEPSSLALLSLGGVLIARRRRS